MVENCPSDRNKLDIRNPTNIANRETIEILIKELGPIQPILDYIETLDGIYNKIQANNDELINSYNNSGVGGNIFITISKNELMDLNKLKQQCKDANLL